MRSTKIKKQENQFPSLQGGAAEVFISQINPILNSFFDSSSFEDNEQVLADMLQAYISPDLDVVLSNERIANTIHAVRSINNLLRVLESYNNHLKGGPLC